MIQHIVRQGECLFSIGRLFGLTWDKLWSFNTELRELRQDPNILFPGDIVLIPDVETKKEQAPTGRCNTYVLKDTFPRVRVKLLLAGFPRVHEPYRLVIGDRVFEGVTNDDGILSAPITSNDATGRLFLTGSVLEPAYVLQF